MNWILREKNKNATKYNAGSKARDDVDSIMVSKGYKPLYLNCSRNEESNSNIITKLLQHINAYNQWKTLCKKLNKNDTLFLQLPVHNHTIFFSRVLKNLSKKGVKIIGLVHDLESLRMVLRKETRLSSKYRYNLEEIAALKYTNKIIVHNNRMKKIINKRFKVPMDKMISLEIFDYLFDGKNSNRFDINKPVVIAGNLDKSKCGYIYDLPHNLEFNLYGANFDESLCSNNTHYFGKVEPDELPKVLDGSFGLVWDGPISSICSGAYGEYLKFNNPHKTSLYLASGLPVIIWDKAALADFVVKNGVGFTVKSLSEISDKIDKLSEADYKQMVMNTVRIGKRLREGYYLIKSINNVLEQNSRKN